MVKVTTSFPTHSFTSEHSDNTLKVLLLWNSATAHHDIRIKSLKKQQKGYKQKLSVLAHTLMAPWVAIRLHQWPSAVPRVFCSLHSNTNHQNNTPNSAEVSPASLITHWKAWCCGPSTYRGTVTMMSFTYFWPKPRKNPAREKYAETGLQQTESTNTKPCEHRQGFSAIPGCKLPEKNVCNIYSNCIREYRRIGRIYWNSLGMNMLPVSVNATRQLLLVLPNKCQQSLYITLDPLLFRLYCM